MINLIKGLYQDELDHFFKALFNFDVAKRIVTKAAFSKARKKLKYDAIIAPKAEMGLDLKPLKLRLLRKDVIPLLFLRPQNFLCTLISEFQSIIIKTIEPIRPGRRYPRNFNNRSGRFNLGYQPLR